jgi:pimeloyl-ACP methyl ester carboxylesterase
LSEVQANGVNLYYEDAGDRDAPALLLISGLGTQLIAWPDALVGRLVDAGFRVVRYDNRDVGRSTHLDGARMPNLSLVTIAERFGLRWRVPYTLTDMARDAVELLNALDIEQAHLVGASMGGAIAQIIAAGWPTRVLTLTSIMSTSNARGLPRPSSKLLGKMLDGSSERATRAEAVKSREELLTLISYPDPARHPNAFQVAAEEAFTRGYNPDGMRRQLLALVADGSRAHRLAEISTPTLVIHGEADALCPPACGADVAHRIAGARFKLVTEMAHDLPPSQLSTLANWIIAHARANTAKGSPDLEMA